MSLYYLQMTVDVVVEADSQAQAEEVAGRSVSDEVSNCGFGLVREVTKSSHVPREWLNAIPYGRDNDERTVDERLRGVGK